MGFLGLYLCLLDLAVKQPCCGVNDTRLLLVLSLLALYQSTSLRTCASSLAVRLSRKRFNSVPRLVSNMSLGVIHKVAGLVNNLLVGCIIRKRN